MQSANPWSGLQPVESWLLQTISLSWSHTRAGSHHVLHLLITSYTPPDPERRRAPFLPHPTEMTPLSQLNQPGPMPNT